MQVMTVRGPIAPDDLGITLPHEHLLIDASVWWTPPTDISQRKTAHMPLDITNLGMARKNSVLLRDNLILDDVELAIEELGFFKTMGGKSVADMTNVGLGRDVSSLRAISEETGINIIAGCGYYLEESIPVECKRLSIEDLASTLVSEIEDGVGDTGIHPGIIGEIGTGYPKLTESDVKMLKVAAQTHLRTRLAISVHNEFSREHGRILDILQEEGVQLQRVVLCHMDELSSTINDIDYQISILERGAYLEYDEFGAGTYYDGFPRVPISDLWDGQFPRNVDKLKALKRLIGEGFLSQILISHDTWCKMNLKRYGGYGYDYILSSVVPMAKAMNFSDEELSTILIENPKSILSF